MCTRCCIGLGTAAKSKISDGAPAAGEGAAMVRDKYGVSWWNRNFWSQKLGNIKDEIHESVEKCSIKLNETSKSVHLNKVGGTNKHVNYVFEFRKRQSSILNI